MSMMPTEPNGLVSSSKDFEEDDTDRSAPSDGEVGNPRLDGVGAYER